MFVRENRQLRKSSEEVVYLQLAESVWDPATRRAKTNILFNFGRTDDPRTIEKMREIAQGILRKVDPEQLVEEHPQWRLIDSWPYGDLYVLEHLWKKLAIDQLLPRNTYDATKTRLPVERSCFTMVANRALAPSSKLYCYEQWMREDVVIKGTDKIELHHLYRSMDYYEKNKELIEKQVFFQVCDLFSCDVDLIFYDTTTLHFEIDEEDARGKDNAIVYGSKLAGRKPYEALRQRSETSKNKRSDLPQIVVGLAMTRDGLPVRSWVFRGDKVDVQTVAQVKQDLRGWRLTRCVFVGDAGMVSEANLKELAAGGGKYILCMPIKVGSEVAKNVVTRPGRYQDVAANLKVKEVTVGKGEGRRRYVVCYNPEEERRQREHRKQVLEELEIELASLKSAKADEHSKRECRLRASRRYGKYLRLTKTGRLKLDRAKVKHYEKLDGKFVVHSNDDTLSAEDMALGYKQLMAVERAWHLLKGGLDIRPVFHYAPHRICSHVSLTMLALLLVRIIENACGESWRNIQDDLRRIKLAQLSTPQGEVWQVTEGTEDSRKRLKQLGIPLPSPVQDVILRPTHTPSRA
jgi:hypothetical protein